MIRTFWRFWRYLRGITNSFGNDSGNGLGPIAAIVLFGLSIPLSAWGDSRTLPISDTTVMVTSSLSTTLDFPISRAGDTI